MTRTILGQRRIEPVDDGHHDVNIRSAQNRHPCQDGPHRRFRTVGRKENGGHPSKSVTAVRAVPERQSADSRVMTRNRQNSDGFSRIRSSSLGSPCTVVRPWGRARDARGSVNKRGTRWIPRDRRGRAPPQSTSRAQGETRADRSPPPGGESASPSRSVWPEGAPPVGRLPARATGDSSLQPIGPTRSTLLEEQGASRVQNCSRSATDGCSSRPSRSTGVRPHPGDGPGRHPDSGVTVQLCGDAHLSNFGLFGTPERQMLFDINDFDETLPGPWEWDVKRLAAQLRGHGPPRGFSAPTGQVVVIEGVRAVPRADARRPPSRERLRPGTTTSRPAAPRRGARRRSAGAG